MSVTLSVSPCPAIPSTCTSTRAPAAGRGEVGQLGKLRPIGNRPGGLPIRRRLATCPTSQHERITSSDQVRRKVRQAENEAAHPARQRLHAPDSEPDGTHPHHCVLVIRHRRPVSVHLLLPPNPPPNRRLNVRRCFCHLRENLLRPRFGFGGRRDQSQRH